MWLLIKVGGLIGALPTIGLVFLTAMIGLSLLRQQGFSTLARARGRMSGGELPAQEMVEGLFLAVGGALLLTPGFVTDALGFACLIPGIRQVIIAWGIRHINWQQVSARQYGHFHDNTPQGDQRTKGQQTIDGEYRRED